MELNHNIGFTLGDWTWDGHCLYQDYHMVSNYSGEEITKAYKELSKELEWDFLTECSKEPELTKKGEQHLLDLGILSKSEVDIIKNHWEKDTYVITDLDEFVTIFFNLVKKKLPDLEWNYRRLNEENIDILDGAAYGLFRIS